MSEKVIFDKSNWIKIVSAKLKFPAGIVDWDFLELGEIVVTIPVDKDKNVYLIREWRPAHKRYVTEAPAGFYKGPDDEAQRQLQARNEMMEEAGFDCRNLKKLAVLLSGARSRQKIHVYLATDLFPCKKAPDEHEYVDVIKMPIDEAILHFRTKEEPIAFTLVGLMLAKEKLK